MLRLLGQPGHTGEGSLPTRVYDIAAMLSLAQAGSLNRKALAAILWPHSEAPTGSLRFVLHAAKKWSIKNAFPLWETTPTELRRLREITTDINALQASAAPTNDAELSAYVSTFGGELLEGHPTPPGDFERWLGDERVKLQQAFVETILGAASILKGPGVDDALRHAEVRSPFDDRIVVARVKNLVKMHRRAAAIMAYQDFRAKYRTDLGVDLDLRARQAISLMIPETLERSAAIARASEVAALEKPGENGRGLPTVLILPPSAVDHPPHARVLGKAMVADVTTQLGRMRTFAMFASYTAQRVQEDDPLAAARSLGAAYVVSTDLGVGRSGPWLGFTLVHTASQAILLADRVPLARKAAGDAQEPLTSGVASTISNHISAVELMSFRRTGEGTAFTHYLLGQERLSYDLASIRKARAHFRRAAAISPRFSAAHAMIARSLTYEWLVLGRPETDLLIEAQRLAMHAYELDPLLPAGPWEMGHAQLYLQRLDESRQQIEMALDRSPHVADLLADHADILVHHADGEGAKAAISKAMELNPASPDEYRWVMGAADFLLGDYRATLESFYRMSNNRPVARLMAACYAMLGDLEKAAHHRNRWLQEYPDFKVEDWVRVIPMRDKNVAKQIVDAMRIAGFH